MLRHDPNLTTCKTARPFLAPQFFPARRGDSELYLWKRTDCKYTGQGSWQFRSCNERADCHSFHPIAPRTMIALGAAPAVDFHSHHRDVGRPLRPDQFKEPPPTFSCSWLELQTALLTWHEQCQKLFANYLVI